MKKQGSFFSFLSFFNFCKSGVHRTIFYSYTVVIIIVVVVIIIDISIIIIIIIVTIMLLLLLLFISVFGTQQVLQEHLPRREGSRGDEEGAAKLLGKGHQD